MGNCLGCRCVEEDSDIEQYYHPGYGGGAQGGATRPRPSGGSITYSGVAQGGASRPRPIGGSITYTVVGYTAVARDLVEFEYTNKVPTALGDYVSASKATQKNWYAKLLSAWKRANPHPTSAEAVAVLIIQTLQGHHDIQGLLTFYRLPWPATQHVPQVTKYEDEEEEADGVTWPPGVKFEIHTLPVKEETVGDGDGFTVFVDVNKDARETANLPLEIKDAMKQRRIARNQKNFSIADALQKQIEKGDYKVFDGENGQAPCLLHKYRIRLRGVDAPEIGQPYGEEAKVVLRNLVKDQELLIHVYNTDKWKRQVGDVYCNGVFIQEVLLKKGMVWHFEKHDKREAFAKWERNAKAARIGLWGDDNPEEPWDYRKKNMRSFNNKGGRSFKKRVA